MVWETTESTLVLFNVFFKLQFHVEYLYLNILCQKYNDITELCAIGKC